MLHKQANNANSLDPIVNHNGKIDHRKEVMERQPEMRQEIVKEKDRSWAQNKVASNNYGDTLARNASSVRSSRCSSEGGITNYGGPKKQPGMENANSIWNSEHLSKLASNLSSKEATTLEKTSADRLRQMKQAEYKQSLTPTVGNEDIIQTKSSTVSAATAKSSGKGWIPANKISLFDNNDNFERLDALQNRVSPKIEKEVTKTANVHANKIVKSAKQVTDNMLEAYTDDAKDTNYKSVHTSAVDRLFDALNNKKSN